MDDLKGLSQMDPSFVVERIKSFKDCALERMKVLRTILRHIYCYVKTNSRLLVAFKIIKHVNNMNVLLP